MNFFGRLKRHLRLTALNYRRLPTPPFLILFINSICNLKCEHCFYWRNLNQRDDLTKEEIFALSRSLGRIENLNLSGGEPFLRAEFSEICRHFIEVNQVRQIYVPTNGWFTDRTAHQVSQTLEDRNLDLFVVELSLDGMPDFHDRFRGLAGSFRRSMETYDALVEVQRRDPRLRIHAVSTASGQNLDEIRQLTAYLCERCPQMDHHNLAMVRGDRRNPSLAGPPVEEYQRLYQYVGRVWVRREAGRYGSVVEPMLQAAKRRTVAARRQVVPCRAGILSAVVYANGDVSFCEAHPPLGNLRSKSFWEIWGSAEAARLRRSIAGRECYCTNEVFLWPSIVFQPLQLLRSMLDARVWRKPRPLGEEERAAAPFPEPAPPLEAAPPLPAAGTPSTAIHTPNEKTA